MVVRFKSLQNLCVLRGKHVMMMPFGKIEDSFLVLFQAYISLVVHSNISLLSFIQVCSSIRMTPEDYLKNRTTLQEESFRSDGVRLAVARNLLKIDVNRTKKLYDFMVNAGMIKAIASEKFICI